MKTAALKIASGDKDLAISDSRTYVVGRSRNADLLISDDHVSRRHLVIELADNEWSARDVSGNGTWHNGERIHAVAIHGEIRLRLGAPTGPEVVLTTTPRHPDKAATHLAGSPTRVPEPHPWTLRTRINSARKAAQCGAALLWVITPPASWPAESFRLGAVNTMT